MSLSIGVRTAIGGETTVTIAGEIDYASSADVRQAVSDALGRRGLRAIDLDLAGVTLIDSTGIGTLVVAYRIARDLGVRLRVTNPNPFVARLLSIVGVDELLGVQPVAEAGATVRLYPSR